MEKQDTTHALAPPPERFEEAAEGEKQLESGKRRSSETLEQNTPYAQNSGDAEAGKSEKLFLDADQALAWARERPSDATPIYLTFSKNDPENPRNWPAAKKWWAVVLVCSLNVITTWCAGGLSMASMDIAQRFNVSMEVTTVCLSMYVLGYAIGPMLLAPLSEYFGRNPVWITSWGVLCIFQIPIALAPNIGTIIVCRFIAGFGGSPPLTNSGGTISDVFARDENGYAMAVYGLSSTFGPFMALVWSGYAVQDLGWQWLFWIDMIIVGFFWLLVVFTLPETRHTTILDRKTKRVRKIMKKEGLAAAQMLRDANADEKKDLHTLFSVALTRPFRFLFTEPITSCSALYNGFIYGLVYLFNEAFPLVFGPMGHGFGIGAQGLSFLGLAIGAILAAIAYPFTQERHYLKVVKANGGKGVPEARMYTARFGAFLLPISLFWFAWTSYTSVHWIVPIIGSSLFSAGIYIVILSILNYIVDSYQTYSASSLAGVILVRNTVGAGFPLFATQMYEKLGYEWASSLLAFLSILMIPVIFLFYYKGEAIRLKSPWAKEHFNKDEDTPH